MQEVVPQDVQYSSRRKRLHATKQILKRPLVAAASSLDGNICPCLVWPGQLPEVRVKDTNDSQHVCGWLDLGRRVVLWGSGSEFLNQDLAKLCCTPAVAPHQPRFDLVRQVANDATVRPFGPWLELAGLVMVNAPNGRLDACFL